ncbi:S-adenosylmethionine decarboxylase [[Brevibacterium] frigoritolerans]|uniref:S-adenosylmethionine decarboxylase n=1 Tax=Peribacillus frigoritolerans TaxID=450367 RepID=A0A941JAB7_9BACI|nr:S-adenosylmethionine decarboxylase [Peribacillus frigoritolerans]
MDSNGQHFIIDAKECEAEILNDAKLLERILTKAVSDLGMEILNTHFHSFYLTG